MVRIGTPKDIEKYIVFTYDIASKNSRRFNLPYLEMMIYVF